MVFRGVVSGCEETRDTIKVCFMTRELTRQKYNSHCVLVRGSRRVGMEALLAERCSAGDGGAPPGALGRGPCGKTRLSFRSRYGRVMSRTCCGVYTVSCLQTPPGCSGQTEMAAACAAVRRRALIFHLGWAWFIFAPLFPSSCRQWRAGGGVFISHVAVTAAYFNEASISSCTWKLCEVESHRLPFGWGNKRNFCWSPIWLFCEIERILMFFLNIVLFSILALSWLSTGIKSLLIYYSSRYKHNIYFVYKVTVN